MNDHAAGTRNWNILVVGIGGVGGYFGGLLARHFGASREADKRGLKKDTKGGRDNRGAEDPGGAADPPRRERITFVARGTHLQAIQTDGLLLNTAGQNGLVCRPDQATETIEQVDSPDLCLVCVKGYDLDEVSRRLTGTVSERTVIMPLLNGVDIRERIRRHVKTGIVLPACVYVSASIDRPGVVTQKGMAGLLICGRDPDHPEYDPSEAVWFLEQAGIAVNYSEDPYPAIWGKYLFIVSFGLVTAWADKPFGAVLQDKELYVLTRGIMEEIQAVAVKRGIDLEKGIIHSSLEKAENFPFETKTSYQRDVEKQARNEGDLFGGTILRMGRELGVPTPITHRLYREIEGRLSN